jgi:signal transduction histidine kinase
VKTEISVLIVEDDVDTCRNMVDILSLDNYQVTTAANCLNAINAVESANFDAVILDWRLPDSNADQLIPIIARHQSDTPVVVVTGMRDFDTAIEALRSGAYDFLLKPINPDMLRSVLRRIVERGKHLAEIQETQTQLLRNERLAAIGQMVTGLAHESRNAFQRSHACLAELELDLEDKPESRQLVRKVQKALDDLHFLLEEVRDYSAPIILERRQGCVAELIKQTWNEILEAKEDTKAPSLELKTAKGFPSSCFLDHNRLRQVLRNLLENAFDASGADGRIEVTLAFQERPQPRIRIEVSDSGEGIAEEERETVFNPFFTTKTKGTGLGLAVSRRYVEAHDGHIFLNGSPEGKGASFVVELPHRTR